MRETFSALCSWTTCKIPKEACTKKLLNDKARDKLMGRSLLFFIVVLRLRLNFNWDLSNSQMETKQYFPVTAHGRRSRTLGYLRKTQLIINTKKNAWFYKYFHLWKCLHEVFPCKITCAFLHCPMDPGKNSLIVLHHGKSGIAFIIGESQNTETYLILHRQVIVVSLMVQQGIIDVCSTEHRGFHCGKTLRLEQNVDITSRSHQCLRFSICVCCVFVVMKCLPKEMC